MDFDPKVSRALHQAVRDCRGKHGALETELANLVSEYKEELLEDSE